MKPKASRSFIFAVFVFTVSSFFSCLPRENSPSVASDVFYQARVKMVKSQIEGRGVSDSAVLDAMKTVKRHMFVPKSKWEEAYADYPLPIGMKQTISQPYIVALMTELLELKEDSKVLEIGTGSGYQSAVLAQIAKEVYSIEILGKLAIMAQEKLSELGYKNIKVKIGDGYRGWPEYAPFDGIIVTAAPDHVPKPLLEQLKTGGRLVIPVGEYFQELKVYTKTPKGIMEKTIIPVRFVPMTGEAQETEKKKGN